MTNGKYWNNVTSIYQKQRERGLLEYGMTLEANVELTAVKRIEMAQEELVDTLLYLEHLKAKIEEMKGE